MQWKYLFRYFVVEIIGKLFKFLQKKLKRFFKNLKTFSRTPPRKKWNIIEMYQRAAECMRMSAFPYS